MIEKSGLAFGILLAGAIAIDIFVFNGVALIAVGKQLLRLVELVAFWR